MQVMIIEVEKKVKQAIEIKTPAYYKGITGYHYINESGQLISVSKGFVVIWHKNQGPGYESQIEIAVTHSKECSREEFETEYNSVLETIQAAVDGVAINS